MKSNLRKAGFIYSLAFTILCFLGTSGAGQSVAQKTETGESVSTIDPSIHKVELLESEVKILREYQQHLLSTVYWSLGIVSGIAVLLVGFSWFSNYKIYERDKMALQSELKGELATAESALQTLIVDQLASSRKDQVDLISATVKGQFDSLQNSINARFDRIESFVKMQRFENAQNEARYWEDKGVLSNAVTYYMKMLDISLSEKLDRDIFTLDSILRCLKAGASLLPSEVQKMVSLVNRLGETFEVQTKAIRHELDRRVSPSKE